MKRLTEVLFFAFLASLFFSACAEEENEDANPPAGNRVLQGEYIRFASGSLLWEAEADELGSLYAKTSDVDNPQWYDIVACTEDVTDFNIELYRHHLFLHVDLNDEKAVESFRIIYYKNKNTERLGDFELMLQSMSGTLSIDIEGDKLSGEFVGKMQNMSDPSDVRQSRFTFHRLPLSPTAKR